MNRRKLLVAGMCAAGVVSLSSVGASAEEKIAPKTLEFLEATTISGYVEASYVFNVKHEITNRNNDESLSPSTVGGDHANRMRAFDNNIGFTMNAIKLVLEKPLGEGDWAAGYRADLLFGQDARQLNIAEGTGNPNFAGAGGVFGGAGTYIEQGYVAFRVPAGNGIDMKFGRFVALSGYEVIESPANLNFSRGLLFTWATPLAHNGLLASYRFNDNVDAQVGIVNGWNTWITDSEAPAAIVRIGVKNSSGTASLGLSGYFGQARFQDAAFAAAPGTQDGRRWFVDGVANWKPTEKVLLGAEVLYGSQQIGNYKGAGAAGSGNDKWFGAALYAKAQLTDKVSIAGRGEYLLDSDGWLFDNGHASFDPSFSTAGRGNRQQMWSLTGTVNFDVWKNMLLRFETRYDAASFQQLGLLGGNRNEPFSPEENQLTFAVDAVYSF